MNTQTQPKFSTGDLVRIKPTSPGQRWLAMRIFDCFVSESTGRIIYEVNWASEKSGDGFIDEDRLVEN